MQVYPVGAGSPSNRAVVSAGVLGFHTCMSGCTAFCWNCHDVESLQHAHLSPWLTPRWRLPVLRLCVSNLDVWYCYYTNHSDQANLSALQNLWPWCPARTRSLQTTSAKQGVTATWCNQIVAGVWMNSVFVFNHSQKYWLHNLNKISNVLSNSPWIQQKDYQSN
jgi:hypothetical protein